MAVMGMRWKPPVLSQLKACSVYGRAFETRGCKKLTKMREQSAGAVDDKEGCALKTKGRRKSWQARGRVIQVP